MCKYSLTIILNQFIATNLINIRKYVIVIQHRYYYHNMNKQVSTVSFTIYSTWEGI